MRENVQFVIDTEGHMKAVILPIEEYEQMNDGGPPHRPCRTRKQI